MIGKKSDKYTFKQVAQITSIGTSLNRITINGEKIKVDPSVLFQRFLTSYIFTDARKSGFCEALQKMLPDHDTN